MASRESPTTEGRAQFEEWLNGLRDIRARADVRARLARVQAGNLGDCKPLRAGVRELRIDHGPGYRVYLSRQGAVTVLLAIVERYSHQNGSHIQAAMDKLQARFKLAS